MSNVNAAQGLIPYQHYKGGVIRNNRYFIDSGAASIFTGDPVKTDTVNRGKKVVVAAAGDKLLGVFGGCRFIGSDGSVRFERAWISGTAILAGTQIACVIYDDPDILFEIQSLGDLEATNVGWEAPVVAGSGNTLTGVSGFQLDTANGSATVNKQLKIVDIVDSPDNAYGVFAKAVVLISNHELAATFVPV